MDKNVFADPSKMDFTVLAKEVTASDAAWAEFQANPRAYLTKHNYKLTLTDSQVAKIKETTRAQATYILSTSDLSTASGLW
jgi:hypothetical protein